jgi:hypothetical protein
MAATSMIASPGIAPVPAGTNPYPYPGLGSVVGPGGQTDTFNPQTGEFNVPGVGSQWIPTGSQLPYSWGSGANQQSFNPSTGEYLVGNNGYWMPNTWNNYWQNNKPPPPVPTIPQQGATPPPIDPNNAAYAGAPQLSTYNLNPSTGAESGSYNLLAGQFPQTTGLQQSLGNYYQYQPSTQLSPQGVQQGVNNAWQQIGQNNPGVMAGANSLSGLANNQWAQNLTPAQIQQGLLQAGQQIWQSNPNVAKGAVGLAGQMANWAQNPGQLDPSIENQLQQSARAAQTARGNSLGTSQAVDEGLTQGMYGQQQEQARLGMVQNYLQSGATPLALTEQRYQFGQNASNQNAQNIANWLQSGATPMALARGQYGFNTGAQNLNASNINNYLNSGQTPESIGSQQLANLINQAMSVNTGYQYNPSVTGIGNPYTFINPNAGAQGAQGANQWYNSLGMFGQQAPSGGISPYVGLGIGAASTAATTAASIYSSMAAAGTAAAAAGAAAA